MQPSADQQSPPDLQPLAGLQNRSVVVVAVGFVRLLIGDMGTVMNNEH